MFRAGILFFLAILIPIQGSAVTVASSETDEDEPESEHYLLIEATRGQGAGQVEALETKVLSRDELSLQPGRSLTDILSQLANVDVAGGPRSLGQRLVIRGLDDARAVLVTDGIPVAYERGHDARWNINPLLLDQVEITTGHFSGLWGSGALAGAVVTQTIEAEDFVAPGESAFHLSTHVASVTDLWSTNLIWMTRDSSDRLSVLYDTDFSQWGDIRLPGNERLENSGGAEQGHLLKARYAPSERDRFTILASRQRFEGDIPSNAQAHVGERNPLLTTTSLVERQSVYWRHDDDTWRIAAQGYQTENELTEGNDTLGRHDETLFSQKGGHFSWTTVPMSEDAIRWLASAEYRDIQVEAFRNNQPRASFPDGAQRTKAMFVLATIPLNKHILQFGVRYDDIDISKSTIGSVGFTEQSPLMSWIFSPTKDLSWRLSLRQTFKAPTITQLFVSGTHFTCGPECANLFVPNPDLRPEIAEGGELGFVWQPGSGRTLNVNFFHYAVQDFIDMRVDFAFWPVPGNPGLGGTTRYENAKDARLKGWEMVYRHQFETGFWQVAVGETHGDNLTADEPLASVHPAKLVSTLAWDLSEDWMAQWQWKVYARQDRLPQGMTETPGYSLHDFAVAWRPQSKNTELVLRVSNLFDRAWRAHNSVLPGQGRDISVRWVYHF